MIKKSEKDYENLIVKLNSLKDLRASESLREKIRSLYVTAPRLSGSFSFPLTKLAYFAIFLILTGGSAFAVASQRSDGKELLTPVKDIIGRIKSSLNYDVNKNIQTQFQSAGSLTATPVPVNIKNEEEEVEVEEEEKEKKSQNSPSGTTSIPTPTVSIGKTEDPIIKSLEQGLPIKAEEVLNEVLGTTIQSQDKPDPDNNPSSKVEENQIIPEHSEEVIEDIIPVNLNLKISL